MLRRTFLQHCATALSLCHASWRVVPSFTRKPAPKSHPTVDELFRTLYGQDRDVIENRLRLFWSHPSVKVQDTPNNMARRVAAEIEAVHLACVYLSYGFTAAIGVGRGGGMAACIVDINCRSCAQFDPTVEGVTALRGCGEFDVKEFVALSLGSRTVLRHYGAGVDPKTAAVLDRRHRFPNLKDEKKIVADVFDAFCPLRRGAFPLLASVAVNRPEGFYGDTHPA